MKGEQSAEMELKNLDDDAMVVYISTFSDYLV